MLAGGLPFSISLPFKQCTVPSGINGPVAIFVTSDSQPLAASVVQQASNSVVAGPTMAFIDTQPDMLSQTVRAVSGGTSGSGSGSSASNVTTSAGPSATPPAANVAGAPGTSAATSPPPNTSTGPSPDGKVVVNGWSNLANSTTTS
jgi:hypothetical protein